MKRLAIFVIALAIALLILTVIAPGMAGASEFDLVLHVTGSKVNTHILQPKPGVSCTTKYLVHYEDYTGDGTPPAVAYSDYLEDLQWWYEQTDNPCQITPDQYDPVK